MFIGLATKHNSESSHHAVNAMTKRDHYPLPLLPTVIAEVKDTSIFTKFDIRWGYNNVRIKEGDQHKAAFKTEFGLFKLMVMFFGLTNSPATFQRMMDTIFADIKEKHALLGTSIQVYMDDIMIARPQASLATKQRSTTSSTSLLHTPFI
jgi:hypothetical protein